MRQRVLKIVATFVCFPLCPHRRKVRCAKGNQSLQIMEYSTPRSKFQTNIWISNFVEAKCFCWNLGINSYCHQLRSTLGLDIPEDSSGGFLFAFTCWGLLWFFFIGELHEWWNIEMAKRFFPCLGFTMILLSWRTTNSWIFWKIICISTVQLHKYSVPNICLRECSNEIELMNSCFVFIYIYQEMFQSTHGGFCLPIISN